MVEANQAQFRVNAMAWCTCEPARSSSLSRVPLGVSPSTGSVLAQAVAGPKERASVPLCLIEPGTLSYLGMGEASGDSDGDGLAFWLGPDQEATGGRRPQPRVPWINTRRILQKGNFSRPARRKRSQITFKRV